MTCFTPSNPESSVGYVVCVFTFLLKRRTTTTKNKTKQKTRRVGVSDSLGSQIPFESDILLVSTSVSLVYTSRDKRPL